MTFDVAVAGLNYVHEGLVKTDRVFSTGLPFPKVWQERGLRSTDTKMLQPLFLLRTPALCTDTCIGVNEPR